MVRERWRCAQGREPSSRRVQPEPGAEMESGSEPGQRRIWKATVHHMEMPERVRGEDLERQLAQWRERRQERRAARDPEQVLTRRYLLGATAMLALALGTAGIGEIVASSMQRHASEIERSNALRREDLVSVTDPESTASSMDAQEIMRVQARAVELANEVVADQYEFLALAERMNDDPSQGGVPSAAEKALISHRTEVAGPWDETAFLLEGEQLTSYASVGEYSVSTQIDPRLPWLIRYEKNAVMPASATRWSVQSAGPSVLDPRVVLVLWVCHDPEQRMLAWAQAHYLLAEDALAQLSLTLTPLGMQSSHRTGVQG